MVEAIGIAIVALFVALPQAVLAIWVMLKRQARRQHQQEQEHRDDPQQTQTTFPMQRWRRCRILETIDIETSNGIGSSDNDRPNYPRRMQDNNYFSIASPSLRSSGTTSTPPRYFPQTEQPWDEPRISAAL